MGQIISFFRCTGKAQPQSKVAYDLEIESCWSIDKGLSAAHRLPLAVRAAGDFIYLEDGRKVLDACGGAAVACLGHGNVEVLQSIQRQAQQVAYIPWAFFDSQSNRDLCDWLIRSTGGKMTKAYLTSSGSEAMDGAMKLAREFFVWKGETQRVSFIAREESYHGATIGPLSLGCHKTRRAPFLPMLLDNIVHIPACNPYRQRLYQESDAEFVARKAAELDQAFHSLGSDTVIAFVAEPVVGAASGCIPPVSGYLKAMKDVCDKYGALLILDEVMCGMGRTGTVHAWEQETIVPDIQTIGKGLGGGFQPCSGILVSKMIVDTMEGAGMSFTHGHTYQNHPLASAGALAVQRIIERDRLVNNTRVQGVYLGAQLQERLGQHRHVGDIRGRGLFWGIEFVQDKTTKEPFDPRLQTARRIHALALSQPYQLVVYYGQGCAGDQKGDHIMVMPAYNASRELIDTILDRLVLVVESAFDSS